MSDRLLFTIAPYVAVLIFIAGILVPPRPLAIAPLRAARDRGPLARGVHVGGVAALAVLLASHVVMWLAPSLLLAWSQSVTRVIAGEIVLFAIGVIAAIGVLRATVVAVRAPARPLFADIILLGVLAVAIASGLILAARYRWASTWSAVTLTPYLRSLLTFAPDTTLLAMPYVIKLHVFSGIALIAVLPFSSVMRPVSVLIHRLRDLAISPIVAVVARQTKRAAGWASESGRALVWPDDEDCED
jgi:nitrate reductase gamma subunit